MSNGKEPSAKKAELRLVKAHVDTENGISFEQGEGKISIETPNEGGWAKLSMSLTLKTEPPREILRVEYAIRIEPQETDPVKHKIEIYLTGMPYVYETFLHLARSAGISPLPLIPGPPQKEPR